MVPGCIVSRMFESITRGYGSSGARKVDVPTGGRESSTSGVLVSRWLNDGTARVDDFLSKAGKSSANPISCDLAEDSADNA